MLVFPSPCIFCSLFPLLEKQRKIMTKKGSIGIWKKKTKKQRNIVRFYFSVWILFKVKDQNVFKEHRFSWKRHLKRIFLSGIYFFYGNIFGKPQPRKRKPSWGGTVSNHRVAPQRKLWDPTVRGLKVSLFFTECRGTPRGWCRLCACFLNDSGETKPAQSLLFFHQFLSLKKNGKAARQYQPFQQFSVSYQSKSPHISRFTILLSKLISMMCSYHLQVIWWHFQKRQEVLTLCGTERELLCVGTRQRARDLVC